MSLKLINKIIKFVVFSQNLTWKLHVNILCERKNLIGMKNVFFCSRKCFSVILIMVFVEKCLGIISRAQRKWLLLYNHEGASWTVRVGRTDRKLSNGSGARYLTVKSTVTSDGINRSSSLRNFLLMNTSASSETFLQSVKV